MPTYLAQVRVLLPFRLAVPQASLFKLPLPTGHALLSLHPGSSKRTTEYLPEPGTPPPTEGASHWYRSVATRGSERHTTREAQFIAGHDPFVAHATDFTGYTLVALSFEIELAQDQPDPDTLSSLETSALERVRYFLAHYATHSPELHVYLPKGDETPGIEVSLASDYIFTTEEVEGHFRVVSRSIRVPGPTAVGYHPELLETSRLEALSRCVAEGRPVYPHQELFLEARAFIYVHANPRLALVLAETAFEVFLQFRLIMACERRGITHLPVGRGAGRATKLPREAIGEANLRDEQLGTYCNLFVRTSIKASPQYQEWLSHTYEPRNAIVHGGHSAVTDEEAVKGIQAAMALANFIDAEMLATYPPPGPAA